MIRHRMIPSGYVCCRSHKPQRKAEEQRLDELLVHPDVGGVADAEGFFQLVQGSAAPQKPDGEGVAEDHRKDAPHAYRLAALPDCVLERLGGGDGPRGAPDYELRGLVVAHIQVAPDGPDRLFGEAEDARGEVRAGAAELYLGGFEVEVALQEAPDLAHSHAGVEHEAYDGGVAGGIEGVHGEGEELCGLVVLEKRYLDRKSTRLNSSHANISYAVFCLKKKKLK